jgi:hypothetical protein
MKKEYSTIETHVQRLNVIVLTERLLLGCDTSPVIFLFQFLKTLFSVRDNAQINRVSDQYVLA